MKTKFLFSMIALSFVAITISYVTGFNPFVTGVILFLSSLAVSTPKGSLAAGLADTKVAEMVGIYNEEFDKFQFKTPNFQAFKAFLDDTNAPRSIITPDMKSKAMSSFNSTFKNPHIATNNQVLTNTRPLVISDAGNTSAMVTTTFTTIQTSFGIAPAASFNNYIDYMAEFKRNILEVVSKFINAMEASALAVLTADKTQIAPDLLGKYTFAANTLEVAKAYGIKYLTTAQPDLYADLSTLLWSKDVVSTGNYKLVGNAGVKSTIGIMNQYGANNDVNLQTTADGGQLYFTNQLANAANKLATGYAFPEGSLGALFRMYPDNLLGIKNERGQEWGTTILPILNLPVETYSYAEGADISAVYPGLTRSNKEFYSFSIDYALLSAYISDRATIASPILKFHVADA